MSLSVATGLSPCSFLEWSSRRLHVERCHRVLDYSGYLILICMIRVLSGRLRWADYFILSTSGMLGVVRVVVLHEWSKKGFGRVERGWRRVVDLYTEVDQGQLVDLMLMVDLREGTDF